MTQGMHGYVDAQGNKIKLEGNQKSGDLFTGDTLTNLSFQYNFPKAGAYSVQFGIQPPPSGTPSFGIFDAVADLLWMVEGGEVRRTVSVGNGSTVSGVGQAVKVTVRDQTGPAFGRNKYTAFVQCAPGTRPSQNKPAVLRGFQTNQLINPAGTLVLDIPQNAGVISAQVTISIQTVANLPILAEVFQKNQAGQILKSYDPEVFTDFVAVAPNATQLEIDNLGAAGIYAVQITWGIDG